ncbi:hypothetical protein EDB87DRAFT_18954 [Lactarius vividus]|nr:hypothetical protein EDB87DRAFT_18954 [Lactarius vividus]
MDFIEWLGFCLSILGTYGVVIYLRLLIPCYIIPNVSSMLNNAEQSLTHAVTIGALPEMSDYRVDLEILANRLARMRIESHRSPGAFPQIWLAIRHGLTCRLYSLASQIGAVGLEVEVAMDERRLSLLATPQIAVITPPIVPAGGTWLIDHESQVVLTVNPSFFCLRCCYTYGPYCGTGTSIDRPRKLSCLFVALSFYFGLSTISSPGNISFLSCLHFLSISSLYSSLCTFNPPPPPPPLVIKRRTILTYCSLSTS